MGQSYLGRNVTLISKFSNRRWRQCFNRMSRNRGRCRQKELVTRTTDYYRTSKNLRMKGMNSVIMKDRWYSGEKLDAMKARVLRRVAMQNFSLLSATRSFKEAKVSARPGWSNKHIFRQMGLISCAHIKAYEIYVNMDRSVVVMAEGAACTAKDVARYRMLSPFDKYKMTKMISYKDGGKASIQYHLFRIVRGAVTILKQVIQD